MSRIIPTSPRPPVALVTGTPGPALPPMFFQRDAQALARALLGKVIRHRITDALLGPVNVAARIIETEAYYLFDRASHSSLGFTERRRAMFMAAGTIYMYYARGADSLNFSAAGPGNAVLVKSAVPHIDAHSPMATLDAMRRRHDDPARPLERLCNGQTLLCRALGLHVTDWDQRMPDGKRLRIEDTGDEPDDILVARRIGIREDRDAHLPYRFVEARHARFCSRDPRRDHRHRRA